MLLRFNTENLVMKKQNVRKSFYLPKEIIVYLESRAKREDRSTSNMLAIILKDIAITAK